MNLSEISCNKCRSNCIFMGSNNNLVEQNRRLLFRETKSKIALKLNNMQKIIQNNKSIEKIWHGPRQAIELDEKTSLGKVLLDALLNDPEHIAQICCHNDKKYTNLEIADLAINIARNFKKLGLKQGDVVGFCGTNTDYVMPLTVASQLNGLIMSTLHANLESNGIKHMLSIIKPLIMFCDGSNYVSVQKAFQDLKLSVPIYTMDEHLEGIPNIIELSTGIGSKEPFSCDLLEKGHLQTAAIMCSSGTTGLPKGVCISHAELMILTPGFSKRGDKFLSFSTMSWATGLIALKTSITAGVTNLITKNSFSTEEFFEIIEKYKPTTIFSPPSQIALLVGSKQIHTSDLSCIQKYCCGGAALAPSLVYEIRNFLPRVEISVLYGVTEVPSFRISFGVFSGSKNVGKLVSNIELKILNDVGESLGLNETGEIVVRSQLPFAGYYNNEAATLNIYDKDGWIHTGDIGYMNENEELFLIDRKKDILKHMGFHFSLSEIENVIMEMPDVAEVCVCGIPDDVAYFLPAAMIVLTPESSLKEEDIQQYVSEKMESYKHLRGGVYFANNIPKTASGKNIRREVLSLCEKMRQEIYAI